MSEDFRVYIEDMQESARRIGDYTQGMDFSHFCREEKTVDAVIYNLQKISAAAARLPDRVRYLAGKVNWKELERMMQLIQGPLTHDNVRLAWDASTKLLPELEKSLDLLHQWSGEMKSREMRGKGMLTGEQDYERWY